ncbi:MAG: glutaredoxin 3 [Kofleriaceae bacterium]
MTAKVKIYTREWCGYCTAALQLLDSKGIDYEHIDASGKPELRTWLAKVSGQRTVPQIFIDEKPIGGFTELRALDRDGKLDKLLGQGAE